MEKILYKDLSFVLNGIFFAVHNSLGGNCREKTYCEFIIELLKQNKVEFEYQKKIPLKFFDLATKKRFIDFIIDDLIVLEIKSKDWATQEDFAQLKEYLRITGHKLGILVLFRRDKVQTFRILNLY